VRSLGPYADALRDACLRMKGAGAEPLAAALAEELARTWGDVLASGRYNAVVPVPHHWRQKLGRAQLVPITMARRLAKYLRVPVHTDLVRKAKSTPRQSTLSTTARRSNLDHAFRPCSGVWLTGGRFLIVDDVLTTGTTADRVARVLRDLGADSIDVVVVARTLGQ